MKKCNFWVIALCATFLTQGVMAVQTVSQQAGPKDPKRFDTTLPVEISSDSLEVLQRENKAIFKGNVVAVQGEVRLKADEMIVHYKQNGGDQKTAASAPVSDKAAGGAPGEMGAVTKIEVEGNVLVATPQESARGDHGDYEVADRMLHLYGNNVVLTRDKNIMRGTALEYNMETGRSILTNGPDVVSGRSNGGRVRSVFVPNQTPNAASGKGAPQNPATPAQSR